MNAIDGQIVDERSSRAIQVTDLHAVILDQYQAVPTANGSALADHIARGVAADDESAMTYLKAVDASFSFALLESPLQDFELYVHFYVAPRFAPAFMKADGDQVSVGKLLIGWQLKSEGRPLYRAILLHYLLLFVNL